MNSEQLSSIPKAEDDQKAETIAQEEVSTLEIAKIAKEIRGVTQALRKESFVDDLPTESVEPLSEKESPGPWSTYYFPSRCVNSERNLCAVCGYTTLRQDIPKEEIITSIMEQAENFLSSFQENVIDKQYGKMIRKGVENPVGLTMSPTGSFFAENELPAAKRVELERRVLEEAQKHGVNLVFTVEAHAKDIINKTQFNYFNREINSHGKEEANLLRALHTQVILGFESRNNFVRNGLYNKNLRLADFEQAISDLQKQELEVGAFVFGGLAPMTDVEAKNDVLETVRYLVEKKAFPVMMFANIQPNTITDVLRENGRYKMLEPFTVAETISEMLEIVTASDPEANWLIPDPVGGPPDPVFNIFTNRNDTASGETINSRLREMICDLRNTRDVVKYQTELIKLRQTDEYQKYLEVISSQQDGEGRPSKKNLLHRTQEMIDFLKNPKVIQSYLGNEKE